MVFFASVVSINKKVSGGENKQKGTTIAARRVREQGANGQAASVMAGMNY